MLVSGPANSAADRQDPLAVVHHAGSTRHASVLPRAIAVRLGRTRD